MSTVALIINYTLLAIGTIFILVGAFVTAYFYIMGRAYEKTDGDADTDLDRALRGEMEDE